MNTYQKFIFICALFICQSSIASEKTNIRLGVLAYGTVNWELTAMQHSQTVETEQYRLQVIKMANPQAGKIALLSGAVDMIVADWVWVSHQRARGKDFTFYPYSNTTGALVVAKGSPIKSIADLKNKKLAIAGGELDKNSLLFQALMQKQGQANIFASIEKVYGAPPLLSQQIMHQRVDALLTYWHYAARLEAEGYKVLMTGNDILQSLSIQAQVPSIGYVFNRVWANNHQSAVQAFLKQSMITKSALCTDDLTWKSIEDLVRAKTQQVDQLLRQRYCAGRVLDWGVEEQQAAEEVYQYLKTISQTRLTGKSESIQAGSFWQLERPLAAK